MNSQRLEGRYGCVFVSAHFCHIWWYETKKEHARAQNCGERKEVKSTGLCSEWLYWRCWCFHCHRWRRRHPFHRLLTNLSLPIGFSTVSLLSLLLFCFEFFIVFPCAIFFLSFVFSEFTLCHHTLPAAWRGVTWREFRVCHVFHFSYLWNYCTFHFNKFNLIVD